MKFDRGTLDLMCPMHAVLDHDGRIRHAGPTLRKLRASLQTGGEPFFDVFEVTRPRGIQDTVTLFSLAGRSLHLRFRDWPQTALKALALAPSDQAGLFLNVSFGISVLEAVRDYDLNNTDFAPTDLAMEMLYLLEAKSAAMDASKRLNQRLQMAKTNAEHQAVTDTLTGLRNRRGLQFDLDRALRRNSRFAIMHLDLDRFKQINDTMGHAAGDTVLQHIARVMIEETRDRDVVARIGGDEFVILLDNVRSAETVEQAAQRILDRVSEPLSIAGHTCTATCSIGSVLSQDYTDPDVETLFRHADRALYLSKAAGRGRHSLLRPTGQIPSLS